MMLPDESEKEGKEREGDHGRCNSHENHGIGPFSSGKGDLFPAGDGRKKHEGQPDHNIRYHPEEAVESDPGDFRLF